MSSNKAVNQTLGPARIPTGLRVVLAAFFGPQLLALAWIYLSSPATRMLGEVQNVPVQCSVTNAASGSVGECKYFEAGLAQLNFFAKESNPTKTISREGAGQIKEGDPAVCTFKAYVNLRYSAEYVLKNQRYLDPKLGDCHPATESIGGRGK